MRAVLKELKMLEDARVEWAEDRDGFLDERRDGCARREGVDGNR
jgi:hypothetical protein